MIVDKRSISYFIAVTQQMSDIDAFMLQSAECRA